MDALSRALRRDVHLAHPFDGGEPVAFVGAAYTHVALEREFTNGTGNEERETDVRYERSSPRVT